MRQFFVGLDIGGTKTEVLIVNTDSSIQSQLKGNTSTTSPKEMVDGVIQTIYRALDQIEATPEDVVAIGAGIPGQVHQETGEVRLAANLGLAEYPLGSVLSSEFGAPVVLENDVRLAAVGTYDYLRQHETINHLAYMGIGTGVSVGLVLNGTLYRGAHGMAGEIGHLVIADNGVTCNCGQVGCLETVIAGPAIARQAAEAGLDSTSTMTELYELAENGNAKAQAIVERVGHFITRAIQSVIMTYDVEKIVLGGGVTSAGTALLNTIFSELALLRKQSELVRVMLPDSKIALLPSDFNAGTHGAIRMAQNAVNAFNKRTF